MDRLPYNILQYILWCIDQPVDLYRISSVCKSWHFIIMHDEYFLNQWFSRSLEYWKQNFQCAFASFHGDCYQLSSLEIDSALFPINLRSSRCDLLPWTNPKYSCDYKYLYEQLYSLSLFESSHSFSFWLFLPQQFDLNVQIGNFHLNGVNIVLPADSQYYSDKHKHISIADRWIHIALTRTVSQRYYQLWIDGEHISNSIQYYLYFDKMQKYDSHINMLIFRKSNNGISSLADVPRMADLNPFERCLTPDEIRAIHQQQTSVEQVKVGNYICNNKICNI